MDKIKNVFKAIINKIKNVIQTVVKKIKNAFRKFVVGLKRSPKNIPLVVLVISFIYYSLNLSNMSNTTALVYGANMGLCQFAILLLSTLSMVCMLNAFPKRKKANVPMVVLLFGMFAIKIVCSVHYRNCIYAATHREKSPIDAVKNAYVADANDMLGVYIVLVAIAAALVALMPLYTKLLKKINTNVEIAGNDDMEAIELSE